MRRIDLFLLLALLLTFFLNLHYISGLYYDPDIPSYTYNTLQILEGKPFYYAPAWDNKFPGINFIFLLAFFIFGKSFIGIQIFGLIANIMSVIFLYFLGKHILCKEARFYFLLPIFYSLLSASKIIQGHTFNTETFLNTYEITGILFLGLGVKEKKDIFYILSGFLLGLGFLIKLSALATFVAGLTYLFIIKIIYKENRPLFLKQILLFIFMFIAPALLILIYVLYLGTWKDFIGDVFIRSIEYMKNVSKIRDINLSWTLTHIFKMLKIEIAVFGLPALIGLFYSIIRYKRKERLLVILWFIVPLLIISRGGFHYRHHFIEIVPALLTLSVIGLSDIYNTALVLFQRKKLFLRIFTALCICILVYPYLHIITPLIKENKLKNSFLLTQKYLNSSDKNKYIPMLLNESYEAARRFLASQHIKEKTTEKDKIFVWDDIDSGAVYLWSGRSNATSFKAKFRLLPKELGSVFTKICLQNKMLYFDYRLNQKILMQEISEERPIYIVVVEYALLMPKPLLSASQTLSLEKKAFKEFFDLLDKNYQLESEIMGCQAYRLVQKASENIE